MNRMGKVMVTIMLGILFLIIPIIGIIANRYFNLVSGEILVVSLMGAILELVIIGGIISVWKE